VHIAIIWQRFLPYHVARLGQLARRFSEFGHRLTAIEVATQDLSYSFPEVIHSEDGFDRICCFPRSSYHQHKANQIHRKVLEVLLSLKPDVVFAPATPFPEGMASLAYRLATGTLSVLMDDAWEHSDRRGRFVKLVKRLVHANADVAFVPSISHLSYYVKMGFPPERIVFGVDVVDNNFFTARADRVRHGASRIRTSKSLPEQYFLYVGRFLHRKGLELLIEAYQKYRNKISKKPWDLVLVGDGSDFDTIRQTAQDIAGIQFAGPQYGDDLCQYYGLANVAITPSEIDPWGLVVNEAMASGLPVIVSNGCGSAKTLIREGENGWVFQSGNVEELSRLMIRISMLTQETLERMGKRSREIIADWSLDRFADAVLQAIHIPRRPPAGIVRNSLTRFWKGHMRIN
jgi:1,2-diacylglycerol 3-alpha-glucosyltransferase